MTVTKTNDVLGIGKFEPTFEAELAARYDIPKLPSGPQRAGFLAEHAAEFRVVVTSGLAYLPMAMTPTYCATKAAIHSYSLTMRYQLKGTKVEVLELVPPYVQTELMGDAQASDPRAMPLKDYIAETMQIMKTQPTPTEINVERVKFLRFAEATGNFDKALQMLSQLSLPNQVATKA